MFPNSYKASAPLHGDDTTSADVVLYEDFGRNNGNFLLKLSHFR